jgi:catechol 2,3-dioxygenase-like lactoylglutathione lyase family enzyme
MTTQRMDNVLIVVDDLDGAIAFFTDLGLELEGRAAVEGESVDRLVDDDADHHDRHDGEDGAEPELGRERPSDARLAHRDHLAGKIEPA